MGFIYRKYFIYGRFIALYFALLFFGVSPMTAQIIDRHVRINRLIAAIVKIHNNEDFTPANKNRKYASLAVNECRFMGLGLNAEQLENSGSKRLMPKLAPTTFISYLTDYKNAVVALNLRHESLAGRVLCLQKKYPMVDLSGLTSEMPQLRENKATLLRLALRSNDALYQDLLRLKIECHAFYHLKASVAVSNGVKARAKGRLYAKHVQQRVVQVARVNALLVQLPLSNHWVDLTIFIALASGRRCIEVLKVGGFAPVDEAHVLFSGQAKTKSREAGGEYVIPILVNEGVFFEAFDRLRVQLDRLSFCGMKISELDNDRINSSVAQRLNKYVRLFLGEPVDNLVGGSRLTFKSLRAIYIKLAALKWHDAGAESVEIFYSRVLGHCDKDILTQASYKGIVLDSEPLEGSVAFEFTSDEFYKHGGGSLPSLAELAALDAVVLKQRSVAMVRLHGYVKGLLAENDTVVITQSLLCRAKAKGGFGANRYLVKRYLKIAGFDGFA